MMSKGFSVLTLANLKPGASRRELPDAGSPGLYFIIQPSGKQSWAFRYRFGGKPRKLTLGPYPALSLKDARAKAGAALAKLADDIDPGAEKRAGKAAKATKADDLVEHVVAQFLTRYAKHKFKPVTMRDVKRMLEKEIAEPWRGKRLSEIGKKDIHAVLDEIVGRPSPISANRTLGWLRLMCSWAVERGLLEVNPCAGIKPPAPAKSRDRVLSDDELKAVWQASDGLEQPYSAFVKLLALTGARRNEIAEMRWQELDFAAKLWTLPKERSKNGIEHSIPLSDMAVEILLALPRISGSDLVFTLTGRNRITAFSLTKDRLDAAMPAAVPAWTFHDLRRTFASGCQRLGIAVHVVEKCLNHSSGTFRGIVSVYQRHDYSTERRAAMAAWSNHVSAVVTGEAAADQRAGLNMATKRKPGAVLGRPKKTIMTIKEKRARGHPAVPFLENPDRYLCLMILLGRLDRSHVSQARAALVVAGIERGHETSPETIVNRSRGAQG